MTFAPKKGYKSQLRPKFAPQVAAKPILSSGMAHKVLPQMSRAVEKTSFYYFQTFNNIWKLSLMSLAFDGCLLLFLPQLLQHPSLGPSEILKFKHLSLMLIGISFLWLFRDWAINSFSRIDSARGRIFELIERYPKLIAIAIALFIALEIFLKIAEFEFNIFFAGLILLVILGGIKSASKGLSKRILEHKAIAHDLTIQIESFNQKVFFLNLIPLIAARVSILLSSIAFSLAFNSDIFFIFSLITAVVMLSSMRAEDYFFMFNCPHCGMKTSRFFESHNGCLQCLKNSSH